MNSNYQQNELFDIKDLLLNLSKRIVVILSVGILFAVFGFSYKLFLSKRASVNSSINSVVNISVQLDGESDEDYSKRIRNVNRAIDLINSIDVLNYQIENNRNYAANSIYMKINSENQAVSRANLLITVEGSQKNNSDLTLSSYYKQTILSGEYLDDLADEWSINQGYIIELIKVDCSSYDSVNVVASGNSINNNDNVQFISVSVIGPTIEQTDKILDLVLEEIDSKSQVFNDSIVTHSVELIDRQNSYVVDNSTRERQITITNRFESLQQQINNYDKSLEEVAATLGLNKSQLYSYYSLDEYLVEQGSFSVFSGIKYAVVLFAVGVILAVVLFSAKYVFCRKLVSQSYFFTRFNWVNKVGVAKPTYKRSKLDVFIDMKTGDDNNLSIDNSLKLLSANIINLTQNMNKVMVTGTAEYSNIEQLIKSLGVNVDVKQNFFDDPSCLAEISNYDGIIIVEQRKYSQCKLIEEELHLISNTKAKLLGAIII